MNSALGKLGLSRWAIQHDYSTWNDLYTSCLMNHALYSWWTMPFIDIPCVPCFLDFLHGTRFSVSLTLPCANRGITGTCSPSMAPARFSSARQTHADRPKIRRTTSKLWSRVLEWRDGLWWIILWHFFFCPFVCSPFCALGKWLSAMGDAWDSHEI